MYVVATCDNRGYTLPSQNLKCTLVWTPIFCMQLLLFSELWHIPSMLQILEAWNMKGCHCWMKQSRPKDIWHRRRDNLTGFLRTGTSQLSLSL